MDNGLGVISINYINGEISSNPSTWIPNNIFFNVYEATFLGDSNMLSITQTISKDDDLYPKTTYIPLSNIGIMEHFATNEDFYKAYPHIKEMKEERDDR